MFGPERGRAVCVVQAEAQRTLYNWDMLGIVGATRRGWNNCCTASVMGCTCRKGRFLHDAKSQADFARYPQMKGRSDAGKMVVAFCISFCKKSLIIVRNLLQAIVLTLCWFTAVQPSTPSVPRCVRQEFNRRKLKPKLFFSHTLIIDRWRESIQATDTC